ncbi:GNAT family N-acetyltransferase [Ilumatobacter sp.]|uniref:GNAT family N-acetyltransferase n=1 Tax=Ilumatobacter sp. TaxID=1967498 RepID=UPI003B52DB90
MIDPDVREVDVDDADDVEQLELLEGDARSAVDGQRGGERWLIEHPEVGDGWVELATDHAVDVLVAHVGDVVVGYIVATLGDDDVMRVDQVWVDPQARECGFGDELLATAIARAAQRGAVAVEGHALPGDRHTKNLYERAGIVARLITTYRELEPVSDPSTAEAASR